MPGPVRQHAAAGKHFGQQQGSRWPERAVQQRRTQPAAPRLRQRLRRSGFRRHRRPPLSRPLGNPALPGQGGRRLAKEPAEPPGPGDPANAGSEQEKRVPRTAGAEARPQFRPVHSRRAAGPERIQRLPQGQRQRPRRIAGETHRHRPVQPIEQSRLSARQPGRRAAQATRATPGRQPAPGRAGPGRARGGAGIPRPGASPGATGTATSGRPATMVHRGAAAAAILRARTRPTGRGQAGLGRPGDGAGNPAMAGAPGSGSRTDRTPEATRAGTPALRAAAAAAHRAASRGRRALARIAGPLAGGARAPGPGRQPSASGPGAVARGFPAGERGQAPGANAGRATGTPSAIEPAPRPAKRRRSATGYGAAAPCRGTGATAGGIARQPGSRRARRRLGDPPGPARRLRATSPARARKPGAAPRAGKIPGPRRGTARTLAGAMDRPPWQRAGRPGGTPGRIAPADR